MRSYPALLSAGGCLRLVLQEPHLVAAAVRLERRVVAAAEVLLALEGRRLPQSTRQAQGLRAVLALAREAPELSVNERHRCDLSADFITGPPFRRRRLQRVDGHAGPVLDLDGGVSGGRGALLVDGGNADGDDQAARQNPVVPRVDRDDGGRRCAHGLA